MTRWFYTILFLLLLISCDDGDIITVELEFDMDLERCENDIDSYLIYDLREDPNESLSLIIPRTTDNELLFTEPTPSNMPTTLTINGTTVRFIYRTYNRAVVSSGANQELCDVVPPADLTILQDFEATTGSVDVTVTIEDDDNDGISSEDEGRGEMDENGNYPNALNTDGDAFPDYLDEDDDNDNVKTIDEIDTSNADGDGNPATNPLDTDNDGTPDYLDTDDDGDGVATIEEDADGDFNPRNDLNTNSEGELVAHYLNDLETTNYGSPGLTDNNIYTRTVNTSFLVRDINLEIFTATEVNFGTLITSFELSTID
ncbi:hypothetical protein [Winogradskyella sp.]|uniref:hypothetical protein n=1 Tax=Winogradskyella sp. TaxID=1883156 RepID=UPI00260FDE9B|nr:hypothetical protein [Winogradskyella sp.]